MKPLVRTDLNKQILIYKISNSNVLYRLTFKIQIYFKKKIKVKFIYITFRYYHNGLQMCQFMVKFYSENNSYLTNVRNIPDYFTTVFVIYHVG
jgi:hypothetical protein